LRMRFALAYPRTDSSTRRSFRSVGSKLAQTAVAIGVLLSVAACTVQRPIDLEAEHSAAVAPDIDTTLSQFIRADPDAMPGASALALLGMHRDALIARLGLIDLSEHSIDLQYYIWKGDTVGGLMLERILRAADRGVRVRLLLDDYASGRQDFELFVIAAHPNIEVRMYNPFSYGRSGSFGRTLAFFHDFRRLNHRMHNKAFIVDNQVAILGGRNIGDKDFGFGDRMNSRDMDVFVAGPVVGDVSESFDIFWNSEWAVQIDRLAGFEASERKVRKEREDLHRWAEELDSLPWDLSWDEAALHQALEAWRASWIWAKTELVVDEPRKDQVDPEARGRDVERDLRAVSERSNSELLVVAPYLIPTEALLNQWREWIANGGRVIVLTNSLRSNNVAAAQYGYMSWRRRLLAAGVELHELRADAAFAGKHCATETDDPPRLSLHAKLAIWDRTTTYIGSLNLDPRSVNLNTEIGLLIDSPELAGALLAELEEDLAPSNSYRVALEADERAAERARMVWYAEDGEVPLRYRSEPGLGCRHRIGKGLFGFLPIEDQL
jgi:putative cardiolipin synthase